MNGSELYQQLKGARDKVKRDRDQQAAALDTLHQKLSAQVQTQRKLQLSLATCIFNTLQDGASAGLQGLHDMVDGLLKKRIEKNAANGQLNTRLAATIQAQLAVVDTATRTAAAAAAAYEAFLARVLSELRATPEHSALMADMTRQQGLLLEANSKSEQTQQEAAAKRQAYDHDPLFSYLQKKGYEAGSLKGLTGWVGLLDRWVGRVCDFERQQANYACLVRLPALVAADAKVQAGVTQEATKKVQAAEDQAISTPEGVTLKTVRDTTLAEQKQEEASLQSSKTQQASAQNALRDFLSGQDQEAKQAQALLDAQMRSLTQAQQQALAAATPSPEDDALVAQVAETNAVIARLTEDAKAQAEVLATAEAALARADQACQTFRSRGFDGSYSRFHTSGWDTNALILGYIAGSLNSNLFFNTLNSNQYTYTPPPPPAPSPSFGGGGFSSGGGFGGGGGFSTGGGF